MRTVPLLSGFELGQSQVFDRRITMCTLSVYQIYVKCIYYVFNLKCLNTRRLHYKVSKLKGYDYEPYRIKLTRADF